MLEFITRLFSRNGGSKIIAKERLRLVLKTEMIQVISKYMEIDESALEVNLDSKGNTVALVANIPVKGMKRAAGALK
jgi:cell division topological specificity factor